MSTDIAAVPPTASDASTAEMEADAYASTDSEVRPVLFQGLDTVHNEPLDIVVTGGTATSSGGASGAVYKWVFSFEELCTSLGLSAKATVAFGATGKVSAKMSFALDLQVTTYSVVAVAYARKTAEVTQATTYGFKDAATLAKVESDPAAFVKLHGDAWVKSVTAGGEYCGVYVFHCRTAEQQSSLQVKLKGEYSTSSGTFQAQLDEMIRTCSVESTFAQFVSGEPSQAIPTSASEIGTYAHTFPSLTLRQPIEYDRTLLGYEDTAYDGVRPTSLAQVEKNRASLIEADDSYAQQLADLEEIIAQCVSLVGTASENGGTKGIYPFYGYADAAVTKALTAARADWDAIEALFARYDEDPTADIPAPTELASIALGVPEPTIGYDTLAYVGSTKHGTAFDDLAKLGTDYCNNHRRVARIAFHCNDDGVGLLETTYEDPTDAEGTGETTVTYAHGNPKYTAEVGHTFEDDEVILRIDVYTKERRMHDGKHWLCVTGIVVYYAGSDGVVRNLVATGGVYESAESTTFTFGPQSDGSRTVFIGWNGYAEDDGHVFGLQPVQARLRPATWPSEA